MVVVKPFPALRLQGDRMDLSRVLSRDPTGLSAGDVDALVAADPRNVARLTSMRGEDGDGARAGERRAALLFAELARAGLLVQDERPAFYCLRRRDEDGEQTQGFFCALSIDEPAADAGPDGADLGDDLLCAARALKTSLVPAVMSFVDDRHRVGRCFEAETEREPDLAFTFGGAEHELWVVDDESTTARISTLLAAQAPKLVGGAAAWSAARRYASESGASPFGLAFLVDEKNLARGAFPAAVPVGLTMMSLVARAD